MLIAYFANSIDPDDTAHKEEIPLGRVTDVRTVHLPIFNCPNLYSSLVIPNTNRHDGAFKYMYAFPYLESTFFLLSFFLSRK